jgi:hypothetical protein
MLDEILKNAKIKEFGDVVVGYLQKEDFLKLWDLREKKIAEYIKEGLSKKEAKRVVFRDKIKIINPLSRKGDEFRICSLLFFNKRQKKDN